MYIRHDDLQARAGGGRLPQLYEATVHLQLRLGLVSRLLSLVSYACHGGLGDSLSYKTMLCRPCGVSAITRGQQPAVAAHIMCILSYHFLC